MDDDLSDLDAMLEDGRRAPRDPHLSEMLETLGLLAMMLVGAGVIALLIIPVLAPIFF
jgi:hypothetical protein